MWRKLWLVILLMSVTLLIGCSNPTLEDVTIELREGVDTIELLSDYEDPGAKAKAFGFIIAHEVISNTVDTSKLGVYEIHYSVTYEEITQSITRIVTVVDTTKPVVTLNPGKDTIELNETWIDTGVIARDNSNLTPSVVVSGYVNTALEGSYIITYTVTDESGNVTRINRYVNVVLQTGLME